MVLFERSKSLAAIRTRFAIADGGAGWENFSVFGISAASSLANLANFPNGAPNLPVGSPVYGVTAGVTVGIPSGQIEIEQLPDAGSETIYCAFDPAAATPASGIEIFSNFTNSYNTCAYISAGLGGYGLTCNVGFLDSGGAGHNIVFNFANSYTSASGNPTFAGPQFFALRVDMTAMLITGKNMTLPNQNVNQAIPAGYTKPVYPAKYRVGGYRGQQNGTAYGFGKRSGASTDVQDALIYAQFQANLAAMGIAI